MREAVGQHERLGDGRAAILLVEVDDGGDVDGAHPRVDALVRVEPDGGDGGARAADNGVRQFAGPARQRVGAAVVVGVGVHVEERVTEGLGDPVDRCLVLAL